ncbi:ribosome biogenesis factor YjgA [Agaribacterium sp. ZY112]|uniref:ribosome biogenesis factor YjgA n=1 Tax=Agaribacterium sp. ZY112 TaxID=3233574 RepID=UPI0035262EAC
MTEDDFWDDPDYKSKTEIKSDMRELRALGLELAELPKKILDTVPMSEELRYAIDEYRRITHKNALKRQASFIGKLIRKEEDAGEALKASLESIKQERHKTTRQLHVVEQWRERLIDQGNEAFNEFVSQFPNCDRQQLRNLLRNAQKDKSQNKPPANARKLFKLVQQVLAEA